MFVIHFSDHFVRAYRRVDDSLATLRNSRLRCRGRGGIRDPSPCQSRARRKVLLVISDGGDTSSRQRFDDVLKIGPKDRVCRTHLAARPSSSANRPTAVGSRELLMMNL